MAWIEQTKKGSRKSGGPQYYLQGLSENVSAVLSVRRRFPIRLWTPYGIIDTGLEAVSKKVGSVGHDRIQIARNGAKQIAFQVAHWHKLKSSDIERIDFGDTLDDDAFVMTPSRIIFFGRKAPKKIVQDSHPLTLTRHHKSPILTQEFRTRMKALSYCSSWVSGQFSEIVKQHEQALKNVDERDLLRTSGALHRLGIDLGVYRTAGIDYPNATFSMGEYPAYKCPVEIEERSSGFLAAHHKSHRKMRAVVLYMDHDEPGALSGYIDVIELKAVELLLRELT